MNRNATLEVDLNLKLFREVESPVPICKPYGTFAELVELFKLNYQSWNQTTLLETIFDFNAYY